MTTKESKKLAGMNTMSTMSTGTTPSRISDGQALTLHGVSVTIILSDDEETVIAYPNGAQRLIDTSAVNAYLDLGTFPTSTQFQRPTPAGTEQAVILAVTGDCCYLVNIADPLTLVSSPRTFTYAEFMQWHQEGGRVQPDLVPAGGTLYVPKMNDIRAATAAPDADDQELATLQAELDALKAENRQLKNDINRQADMHATIIAAYQEDMKALEKKAAILHPAPVRKEYCIKRSCSDRELADMNREGWQIQYMQFMDTGSLHVVFVRDLSQPAAGDAPAAAAAVVVPEPVTPLPAGQAVVGLSGVGASGQPVTASKANGWLTTNTAKPGDTRRIPTLQQFRERQQRDDDEIAAIIQRGVEKQQELRRQFASTPSPFPSLTGGQ